MNKVVIIAWREFIDTVRTRSFFFSLFLVPGIILMMVFGIEWVMGLIERDEQPIRKIALIDESGLFQDALVERLAYFNAQNPNRRLEFVPLPPDTNLDELRDQVRTDEYYAYLRMPDGLLTPPAPTTAPAELDPTDAAAAVRQVMGADDDLAVEFGRKDQQLQVYRDVRGMINEAVKLTRFENAGLDPARIRLLQRDVSLRPVDVRSGEAAEEDVFVRLMLPFAFMFLLFMGTMQVSNGLLTSVLEEKSSRVIEVLLSAVSPLQLIAGKIIGVVLVGLLLLAVWGGVGYYAAESRGFSYVVSPKLLLILALYFVPGFLLISSFLGAVGAACNTLKEAQTMASPVTLFNIVPLILWLPISQHPESLFSVAISYFPLVTPYVMVLRVVADPEIPLWQIITTQLVLWASVFAVMWAAAKIFRIGVLMYGKAPTPGELLRWIRTA